MRVLKGKSFKGHNRLMGGLKLVVADIVVSFLWVLSGALVRVVTAIVALHFFQLKSNEELLKMAVEGVLAFVIVMISLIVRARGPKSFFLRTWIMSIIKLSLRIVGGNFTGAAMNPATAFGWAYSRGQHRTKEHVYVYWLAPLEACLLAIWTFGLLVVPSQKKQTRPKLKTLKEE